MYTYVCILTPSQEPVFASWGDVAMGGLTHQTLKLEIPIFTGWTHQPGRSGVDIRWQDAFSSVQECFLQRLALLLLNYIYLFFVSFWLTKIVYMYGVQYGRLLVFLFLIYHTLIIEDCGNSIHAYSIPWISSTPLPLPCLSNSVCWVSFCFFTCSTLTACSPLSVPNRSEPNLENLTGVHALQVIKHTPDCFLG
jgi:hypothetical protein